MNFIKQYKTPEIEKNSWLYSIFDQFAGEIAGIIVTVFIALTVLWIIRFVVNLVITIMGPIAIVSIGMV